ncbi:2-keto-4-pentenoate hydratase [Streptomyces liangshanensis]|uniref:2-keto-4-pentenoate hydratase n=1 Tax=Streptomyces liangshanensis TaxID=2717324 RepID=UPI0036D8203C
MPPTPPPPSALAPQELAEAAALLRDARRTRRPVTPLTTTYPGLSLDDAYRIQLAQVETWRKDGHRVKGHKVGLTSRAMQRQLGVDRPDYGHLTTDMFHLDGQLVAADTYVSPRIEPEIAFVLARPLAGPNLTVADAISAVDYVLPALEIIDSRIADWRITIEDTVADNASSGGVVLGTRPVPLSAVDLRLTGCVLYRGGVPAATGAGGACLGSPLNALVWLADTIGALGGTLEAGSVILPGSLTAAVPVAPGDTVTAVFTGLGQVTARFAAASKEER